jgi:hypothetical protein
MHKSALFLAFMAIVLSPLGNAEDVPPMPQPATSVVTDNANPEKKAILEQRVNSRWAAMIKKDFTQAYQYFSPAYRKLFSLETYLDRTGRNVDWISAEILEVSIKGSRAKIRVHVDYRLNLPPEANFGGVGTIGTDLDEVWLFEDGNWWYVQQEGGMSA